jgi:hypothetical protein
LNAWKLNWIGSILKVLEDYIENLGFLSMSFECIIDKNIELKMYKGQIEENGE